LPNLGAGVLHQLATVAIDLAAIFRGPIERHLKGIWDLQRVQVLGSN
jgi:hypothetical protein